MAEQKPPPAKPVTAEEKPAAQGEDFVPPRIKARSVRGGAPPPFEVEKWITAQPATDGKFVLIDFWATWCGPCRQSIPELNALQSKFGDRLSIIGVSNEPEEAIRKMSSPTIEYAVAADTQGRMARALQIEAIPHCILIDPSGIVRFEGNPLYLNEQIVQHFLDKYGK
jgi:thiol-disulfide isomerase/thioredoxin